MKDINFLPEPLPPAPDPNDGFKPATDKWNLIAQRVAILDGKYRWGQYIANRTEIKRSTKGHQIIDIIVYRGKPMMKFTYLMETPDVFTTEYL